MKRLGVFLQSVMGLFFAVSLSCNAALTLDWTSSAITRLGTDFTLNVAVGADGSYLLASVENVPETTSFEVSGMSAIPSMYGKSFSLACSSVNGQDLYSHDSRGSYRIGMKGSGVNAYRFDATDEVLRVQADLSALSPAVTFRFSSYEVMNAVSDYEIGLRDSSGTEVLGAVNQNELGEIAPELVGGETDYFEFRAASGSAGGWGSLTFEFGLADAYDTPIKLANIFTDGCVLQRNETIPVWGTCEPGETITVAIHEQSKTITADADGNWRVELDPEAAGGAYTLTVSGEHSVAVVLAEIYFGDVWLLTGQSNMFLTLGSHTSQFPDYYPSDVMGVGDDLDDMRFAIVDVVAASNAPAEELKLAHDWNRWEGSELSGMSTVGYFFARRLNEMLDANGMDDVPLGFIKVCKGATAAEQWISAEALDVMDPSLIADESKPASIYYNGMIAPLKDYAVKGAIWYQGEGNSRTVERSEQYTQVWQTLVESWREQWGIDFPVYYVQLAPYMEYTPIPADDDANLSFANWAWIRESQAECRTLAGVDMACNIDNGFQGHIHPPYKDRVGQRLARMAAAKTYGLNVVCRGPSVADVQFEGSDVTVTFDHVADGLETRAVDAQPDAEEIAEGYPAVSVSADELAGFALCGSDQMFYWAEAEIISANQVRISNAANVPEPVAVRYAWQSYPRCNLYNSEGLPAEPFRTDGYGYGAANGAAVSSAPAGGFQVSVCVQP